jgi:WD40 repeat protein
MTEAELRARLRATQIDSHPEAEQRAWQVVRSAYNPAAPARRRRHWRITVPAVATLVAVVAIVLASASAPREALARWIRQAIGISAQPRLRPMLAGLPSGGQLLVNSPGGPWIVHADGSRRYLGRYTAAAWSPHSLYVVAWRAAQLAALDPQGHPHWTLTGDAAVTVARWSPDGYRIAYLAGRALNIVAGDGSDNHQLIRTVGPITPAWEPDTGPAHRIAFLDRLGDIELRDADTGTLLWRAKPPALTQQLLWSPDGTRLLAAATHRLSLYDARGNLVANGTVPFADSVGPAAFATRDRLAIILHRVNQSTDSVALLDATRQGLGRAPQALFTAPERMTGIDWSPNHRWLLTSSASADQWIFIRIIAPTRLAAVGRIAGQFRRNGKRAGGFPDLGGWQS